MGKKSRLDSEKLYIAERMKLWKDRGELQSERPHQELEKQYSIQYGGIHKWYKNYANKTFQKHLKKGLISPPRFSAETEEEDTVTDVEGDPGDDEVARPLPPLASLLSLS